MPLRGVNPGKLDRRPVLRYPVAASDSMGTMVDAWVDDGPVWGTNLQQFSGREYFAGDAKVAEAQGYVRIRHRNDIDATWRMILNSRLYEIVAAFEAEREGFTDLLVKLLPESTVIYPTSQTFQVDLAEGEESKDIVFPVEMQASPTGIYVQLLIPTGGYTFLADPVLNSVTESSLTIALGAMVPGAGYKLSIQLAL